MKVMPVIVAVALVAASAVVYVTAVRPVIDQHAELSKRLAGLERTNAMLQAQIAELRRRQNDFRTDENYVELEARRKGLTRDNETVFDFSVGGR